MLTFDKHIYIVAGHYGSGKSNLSVNLALEAKRQGRDTVLIDLDIVNPFFRSADCKTLLTEKGITVITPMFANTSLDVPSLPATIDTAIRREEKCVILDVGGDDAGAAALGRYAGMIAQKPYEMLYLIQQRRFFTSEPEEMAQILWEIESASHLKATGVINNTNLGIQTTLSVVEESLADAKRLCELVKLPLVCTAVEEKLADAFSTRHPDENVLPIRIYISHPF